jgi:hypothetical protein
VSPIDWSLFAIAKGPPKRLEKGWKKRERAQRLEDVYALADARDGTVCRVTGRQLKKGLPNTVDAKVWHTRHHMKKRSTHPEDIFNLANIFVCAWEVHQALERGEIEIEGTDANKRLFFRWNRRLVPVGKEPFRIVTADRSSRRKAS